MRKYLLIVISVLLFLPNLFNKDIFPIAAYNNVEQYDPSLSNINTIEKLEAAADSIAESTRAIPQSLEYVEIVDQLITKRFYHGYSHLTLSENWLAALAGKAIKYDLACKVNPEGILKHSYAACSQQAIVMMALLRNQQISYRSVLFPHHYAIEVLINDQWYYFDTNREPKMSKSERKETNWYSSADSLKKYYDTTRFKDIDYAMGNNEKIKFGALNEIPASNQLIFETITGALSKIAWCFPLLFIWFRPKDILYLRRVNRSGNKAINYA